MGNVVASTFGTYSSDELVKLKKGIREMSDVMSMMDAQRDTLKSIIDELYDEVKIPKKIIRKLAKAYHKQNFSQQVVENEEFELFYEGITGTNE